MHWPSKAEIVLGTRVAENHLGQRSCAAAHTGRTYERKRSDQITAQLSCKAEAVHICICMKIHYYAQNQLSAATGSEAVLACRLARLLAGLRFPLHQKRTLFGI